jgi:hypothetical protein
MNLFARLTAPLPVDPSTVPDRTTEFFDALGALMTLYTRAAALAPHSPKHAKMAARYDQCVRLLLADSPNIRTREDG